MGVFGLRDNEGVQDVPGCQGIWLPVHEELPAVCRGCWRGRRGDYRAIRRISLRNAKDEYNFSTVFLLKHHRPDSFGDKFTVSGQGDHGTRLKFAPAKPVANPEASQTITGGLGDGELASDDVTHEIVELAKKGRERAYQVQRGL